MQSQIYILLAFTSSSFISFQTWFLRQFGNTLICFATLVYQTTKDYAL